MLSIRAQTSAFRRPIRRDPPIKTLVIGGPGFGLTSERTRLPHGLGRRVTLRLHSSLRRAVQVIKRQDSLPCRLRGVDLEYACQQLHPLVEIINIFQFRDRPDVPDTTCQERKTQTAHLPFVQSSGRVAAFGPGTEGPGSRPRRLAAILVRTARQPRPGQELPRCHLRISSDIEVRRLRNGCFRIWDARTRRCQRMCCWWSEIQGVPFMPPARNLLGLKVRHRVQTPYPQAPIVIRRAASLRPPVRRGSPDARSRLARARDP